MRGWQVYWRSNEGVLTSARMVREGGRGGRRNACSSLCEQRQGVGKWADVYDWGNEMYRDGEAHTRFSAFPKCRDVAAFE